MCLCLVCDGLFCCVACCWVSRAARVLFYRITPGRQGLLLGVVCWGGVLCENCIVDANAIKIATMFVLLLLFVFSFLWFCSWYFLLSVREKCLCFLFFRRMVDAWVC